MMIAKLRWRCAAPDLFEDEGELLDRRDDDLLALLDEPSSDRPTAVRVPHGRSFTCAYCRIVSRIWRSRIRRSVTTMIESKTVLPSFFRGINWCASHAIEKLLPLPAECWIRYRFPAP